MLPTTKEMAMQLAVMHDMYPDETISELARRLMFSPVFVINALDEGEKMGLFDRLKDEDKLVTALPINYHTLMGVEFGPENTRIQNEILRVIVAANEDQDDVEAGTLDVWLRGIRPADIEIALYTLEKMNFIHKYELANPKDKDTKYEFYTLAVNEGKKWGRFQFTSENAKTQEKKKKK